MSQRWNHFDEEGNAVMVDVSGKAVTERIATASGKIRVSELVMQAILQKTASKGDVLGVAQLAGIMGAKQTSSLIPLCHPLPISKCSVEFEILEQDLSIRVCCIVKTTGQTGVEMEALTGVNVALLTIYDMCKGMDRNMEMYEIHLEEKDGGRSGHYIRENF